MPRKGPVPRREIPPDPKYHSVIVHRLINKVMKNGKKSLAMRLVYEAFEIVRQRSGQDPMRVFEKALQNVTPRLEVRPRRVGGATYQIPIEVSEERGLQLALRWLVQAARERRRNTSFSVALAQEILDAARGEGGAVKKRNDTHRMAEANRAFAHYRW